QKPTSGRTTFQGADHEEGRHPKRSGLKKGQRDPRDERLPDENSVQESIAGDAGCTEAFRSCDKMKPVLTSDKFFLK
ncbi:hypothetical protein, partial [Paracoccus aeridis]|uniref:hypothetical protein n=1 Tax=Paracoccus aeridis TaxID=1966466 RepID=UPI001F36DE97